MSSCNNCKKPAKYTVITEETFETYDETEHKVHSFSGDSTPVQRSYCAACIDPWYLPSDAFDASTSN